MTDADKIIDGKLEMLGASCEQAINDGNADESFLTALRLAYEEIIAAMRRQPSSDQVLVPRGLLNDLYRYGAIHPIIGVTYDQPHKVCLERVATLLAAEAEGRKM